MENKIFIDASAYLSILIETDTNHKKALTILNRLQAEPHLYITSYAVLGEVLTVASQRFNKSAAVDFVENIRDNGTMIITETVSTMKKSFEKFANITDKNISWVDCYSFVLIEECDVDSVFTFDRDFTRYSKLVIGS